MTYPRSKALVLRLFLLLLAGILSALLLSGSAVGLERPAAVEEATAVTVKTGRYYYLTDTNYLATDALGACTSGYRMASLWEILDPSNLTYAYDHPDAHTKADSGQGPPSEWYGRVHTGASASTVDSAGAANCAGWSSVDENHFGTFVRLTRAWEAPPGEIGGIWDADAFNCSLVGPVWCVADYRPLYLPTILNP